MAGILRGCEVCCRRLSWPGSQGCCVSFGLCGHVPEAFSPDVSPTSMAGILRGCELRDFLLVYNRMTELCFRRCVPGLLQRGLDGSEESCLEGCAGKLVRSNQRLMAAYVRLMPALVQRRLQEGTGLASGQEGEEPPSP
ncbi:mitochondrial import inner membrane translocase subunit Tim10 B isoform X2 [Anolis carolinensis]|uniref:mitochondrial import inner membrane translocase subunit Tim10 B isoform X2 n=1 Tax=Anolis carolinensis TaxID=28377 RepID=UPI002F2B642E